MCDRYDRSPDVGAGRRNEEKREKPCPDECCSDNARECGTNFLLGVLHGRHSRIIGYTEHFANVSLWTRRRILGDGANWYHHGMLRETYPFDRYWRDTNKPYAKSLIAFVRFLERRLGVRAEYDVARFPLGRADLHDVFELAEKLRSRGVISHFHPTEQFADEPHVYQWQSHCADRTAHVAGGISGKGDKEALLAALAESLERYLWYEDTGYFSRSFTARAHDAVERGGISPSRFAGFTADQRAGNSRIMLRDESTYLWVRAFSWARKKYCFVPAQTISAAHAKAAFHAHKEPMVWWPITTGLATWPTQKGAILRGALEVIERDAYMITWLNRLSPPRIDVAELRKNSIELDALVRQCERYRLAVTFVSMITDAPVPVVGALVEDKTSIGVPFALGLKASGSAADAACGALLEALRSRSNMRRRRKAGEWNAEKKPHEIRHWERTLYWTEGKRTEQLRFLFEGPHKAVPSDTHDEDSLLERIIAWCRERNYELVSVPLTHSALNPTPWHIEMVVMPDLQPMHQNESIPYLGGERLRTVPAMLGYSAREPFFEEPHPFA